MIEGLGKTDNIILYGCGSTSFRVMEILLKEGITPVAVVDGDAEKWGG